MKIIKLNLGCEDKILKGWTNVDINKHEGVDLVYDLNKLPLPFKDDSISKVLISHTLGYLNSAVNFMLELHRICKDNATIVLINPHFSHLTAHADLEFKRSFSYFSFGNWWTNKQLFSKFELISGRYNYNRTNHKWMNLFINPIINFSPMIYERFYCYLLPASEIVHVLRVVKHGKT